MNNGFRIRSRSSAWRSVFAGAHLPNTRALARQKIAEYRRRKRLQKLLFRAAFIAAAVAVVALAMLLKLILGG